MRIELYGLAFETPRVTFHLWSPWRSTALEHRLFEAIAGGLSEPPLTFPDELQLNIDDSKGWKSALQAVSRVLKGWQEEAEPGNGERRSWRWLLEASTDANGYDDHGEMSCLWGFLQLGLDRGEPGEPDKGEDIDLDGFGLQIWPMHR
jgi:hypothetical protein